MQAAIRIAAFWNKKAALWVNGRKNIFLQLQSAPGISTHPVIWFHCSSLGEFEQSRPVMETLRLQYPGYKILLTFFSPSGYEIRKSYPGADWIFYLPADSKMNARRFLDTVQPVLAVFTKYDYWYYYLSECKKRNIPLLMISSVFRKRQPFFQWYGHLHRKMLRCITHFFVQDALSKTLLNQLNIEQVTISGDTRFDRVIEIAEKAQPLELISTFCSASVVLVAGSTWPADEKIICQAVASMTDVKLILAPHEIHQEHLQRLKSQFTQSVFFSEINHAGAFLESPRCLIIDNIGMLSKLYAHGTLAYVGGGFNKGIHNILEAAVYGLPVFFGPRFEKFREAVELKKMGAAFCIQDAEELKNKINLLIQNPDLYNQCRQRAKNYVYNNRGATAKIVQYIQENRLLTN